MSTRATASRSTHAGLLAALCLAPAALAQPTYQITTIPLFPGATATHALAVNNLGQTVGWARISTSDHHAFLYDPATGLVSDIGQLTNLGAGGDTCGPHAITDAGEVVGTFIGGGRTRAFFWNGGAMIDITTPRADGQPYNGQAWGLSPSGRIVGLNDLACGGPTPFSRSAYWDSIAGPAQVCDVVGECGSSYPMRAINASNAMVGRDSILLGGFTWARPIVITLPSTQVMLPTFDGTFVGHGNAWGINTAGIVCGYSEDRSGGTAHACFWVGTAINALHGLGNDIFDEARSINDAGDVVGKSFPANVWRAVIWPGLSPSAISLQSLLSSSTPLTLGIAEGISNTGFIAATGDISGNSSRAVLLSPCTPAFLASPAPITAPPGATVSFTASAVGAGPITMSWTKGGLPVTNGPTPGGSVVSGATTPTLTITGVTPADSGSYAATATTPCGSGSTAPAALAVVCAADFNDDGFLDFFDFSDFIDCFNGLACPPGKSADFNHDGFVDFFDADAYIAAFDVGC